MFAVIGCNDQTAPPTPPSTVAALLAVSPQPDSTVMGGTRILEARAVDANGLGVPGIEVTWHTTQPGDVIQPAVDTTDAAGLSTVTLQVGQVAGIHGVTATTPQLLSRPFFIHVEAAPLARLGLHPRQLSLVSRQTSQILAAPTDSAGNLVPVPLRWASSNQAVATVDSTGRLLARRPGTTVIYANATLPTFLVDSVIVQVRAAVPARVELWPDTAGFVAGNSLRVSAFAFDSAGRPIDAVDIAWTSSNPQMPLAGREVFADSSVIRVTGGMPGVTLVQARIGSVAASALINAVADPLLETIAMPGFSFCYAGITFGQSGQFYSVVNEGGSFGPEDTVAVVQTGRTGLSGWTKSVEFAECDRTYPSAVNTISVDAVENLYVPARSGVLALDGSSGLPRWHARIGEVRGNIAIASSGVLIARRSSELVALDARDGSVLWRHANPPEESQSSPVIDEARGAVYVTHWHRLTAIDLRTGETKWQLPTPNAFNGELAIANDGTLYVGAVGRVYSVSPAGQQRASAEVEGGVIGSPLIDADGNVYVVTYARTAYGFTAGLVPRWRVHWPGGQYWMGTPVVAADGTVYFGNGSDLVAVRDGVRLWMRPDVSAFAGQNWGFGFDNQLYAATILAVHRFRTAGRDPQAQWPMTHRSPDRSASR